MNIIEQIQVKKFPGSILYQTEDFQLTKMDETYLPTLISEIVDSPIENVIPSRRVGKVLVFDVTPVYRNDPPLIFCKDVDLTDYYYIWKEISGGHSINRKAAEKGIDETIKNLKIDFLSKEEASFLIMELLRYKNEFVRRSPGYAY